MEIMDSTTITIHTIRIITQKRENLWQEHINLKKGLKDLLKN